LDGIVLLNVTVLPDTDAIGPTNTGA
jgi:hypothetical protein